MKYNPNTNKISVIGGDLRQLYMVEEFSKYNTEVYAFGLPENKCESMDSIFAGYGAAVAGWRIFYDPLCDYRGG